MWRILGGKISVHSPRKRKHKLCRQKIHHTIHSKPKYVTGLHSGGRFRGMNDFANFIRSSTYAWVSCVGRGPRCTSNPLSLSATKALGVGHNKEQMDKMQEGNQKWQCTKQKTPGWRRRRRSWRPRTGWHLQDRRGKKTNKHLAPQIPFPSMKFPLFLVSLRFLVLFATSFEFPTTVWKPPPTIRAELGIRSCRKLTLQ